mmetsp:Transcript_35837/g.47304  ORF Transcript_35837/g.47304 Transcript_35837/m.47304 type:complete len:210 (-) Transcript_35837:477-1106(-)
MDDSYYQQLLTRVDTTIAQSKQSSHAIYAGAYYDDRSSPSMMEYAVRYHSLLGPFVSQGEFLGLSKCHTLYHSLMGVLLGLFLAGIFRFGSILGEVLICSIFLVGLMTAQTIVLLKLMKAGTEIWRILVVLLIVMLSINILIWRLIGSQKATPTIGVFIVSYFLAVGLELLLRITMYKFKWWPGLLDPSNPIHHQNDQDLLEEDDYASL